MNRTRRGGFTLIEVLVVLGIISILMAILIPTLNSARQQANLTRCSANLREIYHATLIYASDFDDRFPDAYSTGNYLYRMAPGLSTPGDPSALPEVYGLAAVLHGIAWKDNVRDGLPEKPRYMHGRSAAWICPSASDYLRSFENTYWVSVNTAQAKWTAQQRGRIGRTAVWVSDNYSSRPGLSGFRGPFSNYTIPTSLRAYPHRLKNKRYGAANVVHFDGHIEVDQILPN